MKNPLIEFWFNVAAYYNRELPDDLLKMYAFDLKDCDFNEIKRAFERYRNSNEGEFFPTPPKLKKYAGLILDDDAEADAVLSAVNHAMGQFPADHGYSARQSMGEFAWACVEACGGWWSVCRSTNPTATMAAIRRQAKSKQMRQKQGLSGSLPKLSGKTGSDAPALGSNSHENAPRSAADVSALVSGCLDGKDLNDTALRRSKK